MVIKANDRVTGKSGAHKNINGVVTRIYKDGTVQKYVIAWDNDTQSDVLKSYFKAMVVPRLLNPPQRRQIEDSDSDGVPEVFNNSFEEEESCRGSYSSSDNGALLDSDGEGEM